MGYDITKGEEARLALVKIQLTTQGGLTNKQATDIISEVFMLGMEVQQRKNKRDMEEILEKMEQLERVTDEAIEISRLGHTTERRRGKHSD